MTVNRGEIKEFDESVTYIDNLVKFTDKHPLDHTRSFLSFLGIMEKGQKVIHVAGTNGKGSVCSMIHQVLLSEGKDVGLFISPHLEDIRERIQINKEPVGEEEFLEIFRRVKQVSQRMEEEGEGHPSYFEFLFGMAMIAFERHHVEYVILETGLGGRLDATNAIPAPRLCIITSISKDHTRYLGEDLKSIAWEKAGIIKKGVPLIIDGNQPETTEVICQVAEKMEAKCRIIRDDAYKIMDHDRKHIAFLRTNAYDKDSLWQISLSGIYQPLNCELALAALEEILGKSAAAESRWKAALEDIHWPGRLEEVSRDFFVDGAHNPGGIRGFLDTLENIKDGRKLIIIFSVMGDKDYRGMLYALSKLDNVKRFIFTGIHDDRCVAPEILVQVMQGYTDKESDCCAEVAEAVSRACAMKRSEDVIYGVGSLYLVGEIKQILSPGGKKC